MASDEQTAGVRSVRNTLEEEVRTRHQHVTPPLYRCLCRQKIGGAIWPSSVEISVPY